MKYFADYKSSSLTVKDCKEEGKYDLYDANQVIGKTDKFVIDEDYITIIKDGAGVGRTRKLSKNTAFIGTMGALTVNNSDLDFLYATLNRIDWNTKTFGSTIPHIYFKDYGEKVYGEPSIEEQKKIGLYFKNIDTLITLHQSKSFGHILKVIVSCTLSWEQRKLGDIVREVTRVDENSNAPVMMITANDGFIEQSERYSTDNAGRSLKKYILLKKWELAYNHGASKIRPFGSCFALTRAANIRIPFVYHCFLALEDNPEFLEYTLNSKNVENQLRKIVSSGARMDGLLNISFQEYTSIFIRCPIRKEQDIIAILIKSLDHIITLHQLEPFQLIFKAIAYRIIDYAKSKPLNSTK